MVFKSVSILIICYTKFVQTDLSCFCFLIPYFYNQIYSAVIVTKKKTVNNNV